jgi:hypothetical protein
MAGATKKSNERLINSTLPGGAYYSLGLWPVRVRFPLASFENSPEL